MRVFVLDLSTSIPSNCVSLLVVALLASAGCESERRVLDTWKETRIVQKDAATTKDSRSTFVLGTPGIEIKAGEISFALERQQTNTWNVQNVETVYQAVRHTSAEDVAKTNDTISMANSTVTGVVIGNVIASPLTVLMGQIPMMDTTTKKMLGEDPYFQAVKERDRKDAEALKRLKAGEASVRDDGPVWYERVVIAENVLSTEPKQDTATAPTGLNYVRVKLGAVEVASGSTDAQGQCTLPFHKTELPGVKPVLIVEANDGRQWTIAGQRALSEDEVAEFVPVNPAPPLPNWYLAFGTLLEPASDGKPIKFRILAASDKMLQEFQPKDRIVLWNTAARAIYHDPLPADVAKWGNKTASDRVDVDLRKLDIPGGYREDVVYEYWAGDEWLVDRARENAVEAKTLAEKSGVLTSVADAKLKVVDDLADAGRRDDKSDDPGKADEAQVILAKAARAYYDARIEWEAPARRGDERSAARAAGESLNVGGVK